jgi:ubiquinone/menaquinone biosynthesis C-methylase UbiE
VLDAGCGTGNFAVALARAVFHMIGIDCAPGKLAKARARVSWQLVGLLSFQRADLNLPLLFAAGEFDHVISINALRVAHTQPQHFENSIEC